MRGRKRDIFTTVRTEGNLLPMDLLQRVSEGGKTLKGLAPEIYHVGKNERLNEVINRAWKRCQTAWIGFQKECHDLPDADAGTTLTRERWLLVLFQELAYGRLLTSKAKEIDGKNYPISHFWNNTPIHLISFRQNLDRRTPGVAGAARLSPHGLVQEFLNRSNDHLWGMVSNGLNLRLLRDNASLTRQAYVEFDLEGMMSGEVYSDFILLFLLLHQSRVEAEQPEKCWLEQWTRAAQEQGTRALDRLRSGVEQAITALGKGFLAFSGNAQIRERLRKGELSAHDLYQQLLRLVYRLIFLFVAEDRNLLLLPDAAEKAKRLYLDHYSLNRFRRMAGRVRGTRHADLWEGLRITFKCLYQGEPALALDPLGGFLFSPNAMPDLNHAGLSNDALLEAIRRLSYTKEGRSLRPVDYRNLGTEELGSVYESLLELHPEVNTTAATFDLRIAAGSDRKTTGSYYTPSSLINCLLDSALEPIIEARLREVREIGGREVGNRAEKPYLPTPYSLLAEKALLELKIVDPACGSGHFLIAAAHRMAKHLAIIRTGEGEPAPEERRKAIRDVVSHCIYGVDLNPLAVELCKVALWIETLDPGKPLGFLDHHIKCGNSLIGATPALLGKGIPDDAFKPVTGDDSKIAAAVRKKNREERKWKQKNLFSGQGNTPALAETIEEIREWGFMPEDNQQAVSDKADKYHTLMDDPGIRHAKELADLWTSAFFWPLTDESAASVPTEDVFRLFQEGSLELPESMRKQMDHLACQHRFFHWHLEFPEVFGDDGGFDCVLGNPPWEILEVKENEFFSLSYPEILAVKSAKEKEKILKSIEKDFPSLWKGYQTYVHKIMNEKKFASESGKYPLSSTGRLNLYRLLLETNQTIVSDDGRIGMVIPSGFVSDSFCQKHFNFVLNSNRLISFFDFENREGLFPSVHRSYRFSLTTLGGSGQRAERTDFVFYATQVIELKDTLRHIPLSTTDVKALNPITKTAPLFRTSRDMSITVHLHKKSPILAESNPEKSWMVKPKLMFMMNASMKSHRTAEELQSLGCKQEGNRFIGDESVWLPFYEGKMVGMYDHRAASIRFDPTNRVRRNQPVAFSSEEHADPNCPAMPMFWVEESVVKGKCDGKIPSWLLVIKDVTSATNERTTIGAMLPPAALTDSVPWLSNFKSATLNSCLLSNLNSFILDFASRQKVAGLHLRGHYLAQLPVLSPKTYQATSGWACPSQLVEEWIMRRVLELSYTDWDMRGFGIDCGYHGPPFKWDDDRRFRISCELDAAFFHLYGINRDDVDYIMDTFPIVKRKDEQKYGEYRTKRAILEWYDAMAEAAETGKPHQAILDPQPGPPANGLPEWKRGQPKPKNWPSHIHRPKEIQNSA